MAPNYEALGVAGLVAATLAVILKVLWSAYQAKDKELSALTAAHTSVLVRLEVTLAGLKAVIEEVVARNERDDVRHN